MFLESIYCKNFRNFRDLSLELLEGRNLIVGNNGIGKTNLIEMVYFLSTFSSFRTQRADNLLCFGEKFFILSGVYGGNEVKIKYSGKKEVFINDLKQNSIKEAFGTIPVIALTNEDVDIINGPPSKRRYLMNISISLFDRKYLGYLYEYRKAKKQRNKLLLRAKRGGPAGNFELWEKQLIGLINPIVEARRAFIEKLSLSARDIFGELTGKPATIKYIPGADYGNIEEEYKRKRRHEIEIGYTLLGPHRDNIRFKVGHHSAKTSASFGVKKLLVTSLKIAISRMLTEIRGEEPILLIDEMLGGLDKKKANSLSEFLSKAGQVLITTTDKNLINNNDYNVYTIEEGNESPFIRKCTEEIHTF